MTKSVFAYRNGVLCAEALPLAEIAEEMDTPFLCFSAKQVRRTAGAFASSFAGGSVSLRYDLAHGASLAVLDLLAKQGIGVCVSSSGEIERALEAGFHPARMVMEGCGKTHDDIAAALLAGVSSISAGSLAELHFMTGIAKTLGRKIPVSLVYRPASLAPCAYAYGFVMEQIGAVFSFLYPNDWIEFAGISVVLPAQKMAGEKALYELVRLIGLLRDQGIETPAVTLSSDSGQCESFVKDILGPVARQAGCLVHLRVGDELMQEAGLLVSRILRIEETAHRRVALLDIERGDVPARSFTPLCMEAIALCTQGASAVPSELSPVLFVDRKGQPVCLARLSPLLAGGDLVGLMGPSASRLADRLLVPEIMVFGVRYAIVRRRVAVAEQTGWEAVPDRAGNERAA